MLEPQLEAGVGKKELERRLRKLSRTLSYDWRQREAAAICHRRRQLRKLHELGIFIANLPKCFGINLTL